MLDPNNRPDDIDRQIKEGKLRFKDPVFYWDNDEDDDTRPLEEEDFGCVDL